MSILKRALLAEPDRSPQSIKRIPTMTDLSQEADRILNTLAFQPFDRCQTLQRNFTNIPASPGLYAVRHRSIGLLYIGKSKSLRGRFSGGHKAFL